MSTIMDEDTGRKLEDTRPVLKSGSCYTFTTTNTKKWYDRFALHYFENVSEEDVNEKTKWDEKDRKKLIIKYEKVDECLSITITIHRTTGTITIQGSARSLNIWITEHYPILVDTPQPDTAVANKVGIINQQSPPDADTTVTETVAESSNFPLASCSKHPTKSMGALDLPMLTIQEEPQEESYSPTHDIPDEEHEATPENVVIDVNHFAQVASTANLPAQENDNVPMEVNDILQKCMQDAINSIDFTFNNNGPPTPVTTTARVALDPQIVEVSTPQRAVTSQEISTPQHSETSEEVEAALDKPAAYDDNDIGHNNISPNNEENDDIIISEELLNTVKANEKAKSTNKKKHGNSNSDEQNLLLQQKIVNMEKLTNNLENELVRFTTLFNSQFQSMNLLINNQEE